MHPTMIYTSHDDSVEIKDSEQQARVDQVVQTGVGPVTATGLPAGDSGFSTDEQYRVIIKEADRVQAKLDENRYDPKTGLATPVYQGRERDLLERELAQIRQSFHYQAHINANVVASRADAQDYRTQQLTQELQRQELTQGLFAEEQDVVEEIARGIIQARTRRLQNR